MKILLTLLVGAWVSCSFGALQYQLVSTPGGNQWNNWPSAQKITIKVTEGGSLWMTSYIDNPGGWNIPDLSTIANMGAGNYGVTNTATGVVTQGTGEVQAITYNTSRTFDVNAYYVGDFETGDVLSFWVTSKAGAVYNSTSDTHDVNPAQAVNSRLIKDLDSLGNTRINFSGTGGGLEFILAGGEYKNAPSGQPLPGVIATLLLGSGALALHRRRKNKNA
jgi:hypothetical protein